MKYFYVTYDGSFLGGTAVVRAVDEADAILKVKQDKSTCNFVNVAVTEIPENLDVLYNDNGDY